MDMLTRGGQAELDDAYASPPLCPTEMYHDLHHAIHTVTVMNAGGQGGSQDGRSPTSGARRQRGREEEVCCQGAIVSK